MGMRFAAAPLLVLGLSAHAHQPLDTPEQIVAAVQVQGAKPVVLAMLKAGTWQVPFLRDVSRADQRWLAAAATLAVGSSMCLLGRNPGTYRIRSAFRKDGTF